MAFNVTEITNQKLSVQEQTSYGLVFVPPLNNVNIIHNGWSIGHYPKLSMGYKNISSTTQGQYIHFRFHGRRVGVLLAKMKGYGKLSFDIDGTDYGQVDCSFADWYQNNTSINYNVPFVIATDLPDGEHLLTITKPDALNTVLNGFLVDDAGWAQPNFNFNYHTMFKNDGVAQNPVSIGTSATTLNSTDMWVFSAIFTNTTASPITVTVKNGNNNTVMVLPIPANDIRQVSGPFLLAGTSTATASATGVSVILGGQ